MKSNRTSIVKLLKRAYRSWGVRAIAILLTIILCSQTIVSSGVPQAIAQELGQILVTRQADDAGAADEGAAGTATDDADQAGTEDPAADAGASASQTTDGAVTEGATTGAPANPSDTAGTAAGDAANSAVHEAEPSTPSEDSADDAADSSTNADDNADDPAADTADDPAERTDPYAWTGDLGALKLSSTGLSIALPSHSDEATGATDARGGVCCGR